MLFQTLSSVVDSVGIAADIVPNPAPEDPTGGSDAIDTMFAFVKWGVIIICGIVALAAGGFIAWGSTSNRPDAAEKGKKVLIGGVLGVLAAAVAVPMINAVFNSTT
ncbi:hypothetical protein [Haloglycomyces albus]|uniref:hypothetical protein n=1 Tax=Haloglycomyces albus TaxID=526067 RepID=UPI00046D17EE|nr:hypothetical protein [Haloglycomyces albus]